MNFCVLTCWRKQASIWAAICFMVLLVSACGQKNRLVSSWVDPAVKVAKVEDALVIGVARDATIRRLYEDSLSRGLYAEGVRTIQGHRVTAVQETITYETVVQAAQETKAKTVLISHLADATRKISSGDALGRQYGDLKDLPMTVDMVASTAPRVASTSSKTTLWLESRLYDVATRDLLWSAQVEVVDPVMTNKAIDKATILFVQDLKAKGLL